MRKLIKLIIDFCESNPKIDFSKIDAMDKEIFKIDMTETRDLSTQRIYFDDTTIHYSVITWMTTVKSEYNESDETFEDDCFISDYILAVSDFSPKEAKTVLRDIQKLFGNISTRLFYSIQILKNLNPQISDKTRKVIEKEEKRFEKRIASYNAKEEKDHRKYMRKYGG